MEDRLVSGHAFGWYGSSLRADCRIGVGAGNGKRKRLITIIDSPPSNSKPYNLFILNSHAETNDGDVEAGHTATANQNPQPGTANPTTTRTAPRNVAATSTPGTVPQPPLPYTRLFHRSVVSASCNERNANGSNFRPFVDFP